MTDGAVTALIVVGDVAVGTLLLAQLIHLFIHHATHQSILMTDLLYLLVSIGFFALMLVFVWACEKV